MSVKMWFCDLETMGEQVTYKRCTIKHGRLGDLKKKSDHRKY